MNHKLSVIVPVYNKKDYIHPCLDSILRQTLRDIELVVVDDGSTDDSPRICDEYAANDARVRVIHKPNGGLVSAWKAGVLAATAPYVGFVDADDWVDDGYYEALYTAITAEHADIAINECVRDPGPGITVPPYSFREKDAVYEGEEEARRFTERFLLDIPFGSTPFKSVTNSRCDKLYRRELLLSNMSFFNEKLTAEEDTVANTAMFLDCRKIVLLSHRAKYHYRILSTSMSHSRGENMQIFDIREIYQSFAAISQAKGLDMRPVDAYVGNSIYKMIYRLAANPAINKKTKLAYSRQALDAAPGALSAYARFRGGMSIRLFCGLLDLGLLRPVFWLVHLFEAAKGRRQ